MKFVRIKKTVMEAAERFLPLPDDTRAVPVIMHVKGYYEGSAAVGEEITITTPSGREESGILVDTAPAWDHNFGSYTRELVELGLRIEAEKEGLS